MSLSEIALYLPKASLTILILIPFDCSLSTTLTSQVSFNSLSSIVILEFEWSLLPSTTISATAKFDPFFVLNTGFDLPKCATFWWSELVILDSVSASIKSGYLAKTLRTFFLLNLTE